MPDPSSNETRQINSSDTLNPIPDKPNEISVPNLNEVAASTSTNESIEPKAEVHSTQFGDEKSTLEGNQIFFQPNADNRPHIKVKVKGQMMTALVDTGAQITVVGQNLVPDVKLWGKTLSPAKRKISTVDQTSHSPVGTVDVRYTFNGMSKIVPTTILPIDMRELIVGMDFIQTFNIALTCGSEQRVHSIETDSDVILDTVTINSIEQTTDSNDTTAEQFLQWANHMDPTTQIFTVNQSEQEADDAIDITRELVINDEDITPPKMPCVKLPHKLTPEQRQTLDSVLDLFTSTADSGPLNKTSAIEHVIDTTGKPIMRKQYPMSPYVMEKVQVELDKMKARDIIVDIDYSPWRSPILVVGKKDGGSRVCLDARELNKVTVPNAYPITDTNQILSRLKNTKYLSSIDLSQAFFQIPLAKDSRFKTAFAFGNRLYCFKRMTMGLRNSPATLAVLIDKIFRDLHPHAFAYVDDFIICTDTFEEHVRILAIIARRLTEVGLTISSSKSHFCCKRLEFLGYILSEDGLSANPSRITAILDIPQPTTTKEVRRFIGAAGWYRRFINDFAGITAPLTDLTKGEARKIEWNDKAETAFVTLKEKLTTAPILAMCDYSKPFKIYSDASLIAGAAVLTQELNEHERVITYYSVKFNPAQQNYSASERECLAVLSAVEKFRPYIDGVKFTVVTDHSALKWLMSMKDPKGRLARWAIRLQAFEMEIVHKSGKHMEMPDALSRAVALIDINSDQTKDQWYHSRFEKATKQELDKYKVTNGLLYYRYKFTSYSGERLWVLCVPKELHEQVLLEQHEQFSHQGTWKFYHRARTLYYWPNMFETVYQYVRKCDVCRRVKPSNENKRTPIGQYRDPKAIGRQLSIDLVGPLPLSKNGNRFLFVVLDCYSRFVYVKPLRQATTASVVKFLENEVFHRNGCPEIIISDNGKQFVSQLFNEMCESRHIHHMRTPVYHPKANQVESTNKNIKMALKTYLDSDKNHAKWEDYVTKVVIDLNTTPHTSTGRSPFYLNFGREMVRDAREHKLLLDANPQRTLDEERMQIIRDETSTKQRDTYEDNRTRQSTRTKKRTFASGAEVFIPNNKLSSGGERYAAKLAPRKIRAYVKAKKGDDTYELVDKSGKPIGVYHADDIMTR